MEGHLKVIQSNIMKSSPLTESLLQTALENNVSLVLIQEPRLITNPIPSQSHSFNLRSINHPSFFQLLPKTVFPNQPRVLAYVLKSTSFNICLREDLSSDPDYMILEVRHGGNKFFIYNIYNQKDQLQSTSPRTFERVLRDTRLLNPSLVLGDFNLHHPSWDPLSCQSPGAECFVDWTEDNNLTLLNCPGERTFFRPQMERETVLDLTYVSTSLVGKIKDWQILPSIGSDHKPIIFTVIMRTNHHSLSENPATALRFNTRKADWKLFKDKFNEAWEKYPHSKLHDPICGTSGPSLPMDILQDTEQTQARALDQLAEQLTWAIQYSAEEAIPKIKPGAISKPWWNKDLKLLRKTMQRKQQAFKQIQKQLQEPGSLNQARDEFRRARNAYTDAIQKAKINHWDRFLEKEDPQTIFKAMAYTKESQVQYIPPIQSVDGNLETSFEGKAKAFRHSLFPSPPKVDAINWENYRIKSTFKWPPLTVNELEQACSSKIKGKTPGPDAISQDMIIEAYEANPNLFFRVYSSLFNSGYHPRCWREATGAILRKPNKLDYAAPKAYRVISLLNCLGKVLERIIAKRLSGLAETTDLLHSSQIGGRLRKSAVDAALLLTDEIQSQKQHNRKTTTLFLDIKGAFDHVAKDQLLGTMKDLGLPVSLLSWTKSFLSHRKIQLSFDGQKEQFCQVETGIPQGSPVSPILFLIYIRNLFQSHSVKILSYVDDISLTVSSASLRKNVQILEREVAFLYHQGAKNAVEFDMDKTELIHFTKSKEACITQLKLPNGNIVKPKTLIRWLGIWFDSQLSFKEHVSIRAQQARNAFFRMARLANINKGLSPHSIRQIYLACITSVADYGSPVWWRNQTGLSNQLQKLQNQVARKILGVFRTAPVKPMEIEAGLLPPQIRLNKLSRAYAFRILTLQQSHPVRKILMQNKEEDEDESRNQKKPTQSCLLWTSIKDSWPENVEKIHYSAPYTSLPKPPIHFIILNHPKAEVARIHNCNLERDRGTKVIYIYTDASSFLETEGVGVGLIAIDLAKDRAVYESFNNIGPDQIVYNGELEGICQALEYIGQQTNLQGYKIKIFSDNKAAIYRLQTNLPKPGQAWQIRASEAAILAIQNGVQEISIEWVPGHLNIEGNEIADSLAKQGTKVSPSLVPCSLASIKSNLMQLTKNEWQEDYLKYKTKAWKNNPSTYSATFEPRFIQKIQLPSGVSRNIASSFYQLKLGHGYFQGYMYKIKRHSTGLCDCNRTAKQTPRHLLLECAKYKNEQKKLLENLRVERPTMELLLNTTKGIKLTLEYLRNTHIATLKWFSQGEWPD